MTISQAIKELKEQKLSLDRHVTRGATYCADYAEALGMAIVALKKQVPRALHSLIGDDGLCPSCGYENENYNSHCVKCGQAISGFLSECIKHGCYSCGLNEADGPVCPRYADKVDEIRRIHEEAGNDR